MGIFYTLNVFIMQFYLGAPLRASKAAAMYARGGIRIRHPLAL